MDPYLTVKWVHILSSTILFGTGIGTALQMFLAHRSGDAHAIALVARNVVRADWLCTLPAGIVQPVTGGALIYLGGIDPWQGWLVVSYGLYVVAGLCWIIVVRLQLRMAAVAAAAALRREVLPPEYFSDFRLWFLLGWPAFLGLIVVFGIMVFKPDL